jgi:hypothetical protein
MAKSEWACAAYVLHDTADPVRILVSGRNRWALECLILAGDRGCTPIEIIGPRVSAYVFNLRKMGVRIETLTEPHGGAFAGHHARYVLRSTVTREGAGC